MYSKTEQKIIDSMTVKPEPNTHWKDIKVGDYIRWCEDGCIYCCGKVIGLDNSKSNVMVHVKDLYYSPMFGDWGLPDILVKIYKNEEEYLKDINNG